MRHNYIPERFVAAVRLTFFCLAFAFHSTGRASAQNTVADWFPLHPGDKWSYRHETRDENGEGRAHPEVHRWKTEETITGSWTVPEGTIAGMQVQVTEGSPRAGYRVVPNPAWLIRGACLYRLGARDRDPSAHSLTPDFLKWLGAGEFSADFCFPLVTRKTWGAPHWGGIRPPPQARDWEVWEPSIIRFTLLLFRRTSVPA